MSWKPEVEVEGTWTPNGMAFETEEEAEQWGRDLLMRWFVPTDSRAVESDELANYAIVDNKLVQVTMTESELVEAWKPGDPDA